MCGTSCLESYTMDTETEGLVGVQNEYDYRVKPCLGRLEDGLEKWLRFTILLLEQDL